MYEKVLIISYNSEENVFFTSFFIISFSSGHKQIFNLSLFSNVLKMQIPLNSYYSYTQMLITIISTFSYILFKCKVNEGCIPTLTCTYDGENKWGYFKRGPEKRKFPRYFQSLTVANTT